MDDLQPKFAEMQNTAEEQLLGASIMSDKQAQCHIEKCEMEEGTVSKGYHKIRNAVY